MNHKRKASSERKDGLTQTKRHRTASPEGDDEPTSKAPQPRVDPTYGQRGAFPGLDDGGEDSDLFYGPASDGLEYLRMVRSEAKTVPNLLVADSASGKRLTNLDAEQSQGYYADGAYTAAPGPTANGLIEAPGNGNDEQDPQEAYYTALCARFAAVSSLLQQTPPSNLISFRSSQVAQRVAAGSSHHWRSILNAEPSTAILGQLSQDSVLQGLRVLETRFTQANIMKKPNLGLWAWGLLAKCREAGQMGSEDIGILRDLGKRAVWLLRGMQAGVNQTLLMKNEQSHTGDEDSEGDANEKSSDKHESEDINSADEQHQHELPAQSDKSEPQPTLAPHNDPNANNRDSPDALVAAKHRMLSSLPHEPATEEPSRLYATLDMIITIVGECYGQRDLLDGRLVWGEVDIDR